jgi:hypothetical protein
MRNYEDNFWNDRVLPALVIGIIIAAIAGIYQLGVYLFK